MSLLLEALKKAEKAKEEAQRRARGESGAAEVRMEGEATGQAKPVLTRAELPDIKQPLEILSDDISPQEAAPPAGAAAQPIRSTSHTSSESELRASERAAAKNVFEAKFREPGNPRMPFFITLGLLGLFAAGTAGYFSYQLRPPPPLVNANPIRNPNEVPVQLTAVSGSVTQPAVSVAQGAIPGLPAAAAAVPAAGVPEPRVEKPPVEAPRVEASAPRPKPAAPRPVRPTATASPVRVPVSTVSSRRPVPQVHPKVQTAYAAYLKGDFAAAHADYQDAVRDESTNRDALLGLAAAEVRTGRLESAEATYLRLLQMDPTDAHAQAGIIALRSSRLDPLATESRVKTMLAADPEANVLQFTLGNQLAQQGRWEEAQRAYFKAFAASPENPDFAYNLAVSLDHLRQGKVAIEYYRRAVELAERRGASFDLPAARARAALLEK